MGSSERSSSRFGTRDDKGNAPESGMLSRAGRDVVYELDRLDGTDPFFLRLGPYLLLAALALVFFLKLVLHPTWVLYTDYSDLLTYQIPQVRYLVSSWQRTGELPLWCPYSFAGMPFIHDLQVGAFYPPHLVLYLLPDEMIGPALSWLVVTHVIAAGWTMFAYASSQGLNRTCSVIAGAGYMFSGKWMLHLLAAGQYVAVGLAWIPLVLLLLERSVARGRLREATWAGVAFALVILESHPQFTFYAGMLMVLWTFPLALERSGVPGLGVKSWRKIATGLCRWLAAVGWCFLVALALTAVQLMPTVEAAAQTTRGASGMQFEVLSDFLFNLTGLVGPAPSNLPVVGWEHRTGLTVLWMATALLAPVVARGRLRVRIQTFICMGMIVFGLGAAFVFQSLPGFRLFRYPARMFLLVSLPVSLLAGMVCQAMFDLLRSEQGLRRITVGMLILLILIGLESTAILCWKGGRSLGTPLLIYWGSLLATLPIACWLLWCAGRADDRLPRWLASRFELVWGVLLVVDLWAMGWPLVEVRPQESVYAPSSCITFMIEGRNDHERILDRELPDHPGSTPLGLALPILHRLDHLRGYNPLDIHRYKEYLQFISDRDGPVPPGNGVPNFPLVNKPLLDMLGTRFLLQPTDFPLMEDEPQEVPRDPRWKAAYQDPTPEIHVGVAERQKRLPPFTVYENREVFPRAFVVPRAQVLPARGRVLGALKQADLHQVVFLEDFTATPARSGPAGGFQSANITVYEPNHVVVDVDALAPGYLVLSDPWYPGWSCTLDNAPTRLYRANYAFRAAAVPAGKHRLRFDFLPASYGRGRLISGASLAAIVLLAVVQIVRRRWPQDLPGWSR
jgi:hypothetical protein